MTTDRRAPDAPWFPSLLLAALALGCGGGPPVSTETAEATVRGTVKVRGKAVTKGEITFNPANVARRDAVARTVAIGADGSYEVTTLVGGNRVSIAGPEVRKHPGLEYEELSIDVKAGENTFDADFQPPGRPRR